MTVTEKLIALICAVILTETSVAEATCSEGRAVSQTPHYALYTVEPQHMNALPYESSCEES